MCLVVRQNEVLYPRPNMCYKRCSFIHAAAAIRILTSKYPKGICFILKRRS